MENKGIICFYVFIGFKVINLFLNNRKKFYMIEYELCYRIYNFVMKVYLLR